MKRGLILLLMAAALLAPRLTPAATDAAATRAKLVQIQQERQRLAAARRQMQSQLGSLGRQMHTLDVALSTAQQARLQAAARVAEADKTLQALAAKQQGLERHIAILRQSMISEAIGAWQRAGRQPGWLDVLSGVPMGEIPNRRYMMRRVIASQQGDRLELKKSEAKLDAVMADVRQERDRREALHRQRQQAEDALRQQLAGKRQLVSQVRHSARLQRQQDHALAGQARALRRLLQAFGGDLLAADRVGSGPSIRAEKGRLHWPLSRARIVARYGTRMPQQSERLHGVLLAPDGQARQVKSISSGRVRYADWFGGYGLMLIVDHGDGVMSIYAHNDVLYKHLGDWVEPGDVLAEAGSTGWTDKVRLYFELRDHGRPVNPVRWCRAGR
jgi:septal ring factor EnvC (AmiA/AmiB activator)